MLVVALSIDGKQHDSTQPYELHTILRSNLCSLTPLVRVVAAARSISCGLNEAQYTRQYSDVLSAESLAFERFILLLEVGGSSGAARLRDEESGGDDDGGGGRYGMSGCGIGEW